MAFLALSVGQSYAQWVGITSDAPTAVKKELINSDVTTSVVEFSLDGFYMNKVETPNGIEYVITTEKATPILKAGAPDVAKTTASIIIPDMDEMQINVIDAQYKEYENIAVAPSKGNFTRDINPDDVAYTYGEEYNQNAFYPAEVASLRTPYILRDYRGQTIVFNPFRYNAVTKTLRVYTSIKVEVSSTGNTGENVFARTSNVEKVAKEFTHVYGSQFLNFGNDTRYTPVEEAGNILIIAYADFMDAMQPYIDWKIETGREVEIVDVSTIGGSSDIDTYIEDYYNNNGLTYCLLVGDASQVASSYSSGDSDNAYAYIEGNDHYPEIFMGRFSAESEDDVATMVTRTLEYEMTPYTDEDWYPNSISVGSSQGPGDDGEYDYEHLRNIQDDLNGFGYTYNYEYYDGSQGGNDASGNPDGDDVAVGINAGASIINYTGHGSTTSWSSSGFSNSDVNDLVNANKLPFIWSVACVNGNFVGNTCFAEAWLRATDSDGNPTGAVATLMSTINQSWNPPMEGQDDMNDLLTEQFSDNIKRTFGGLSFNGCMQMNDEYGSEGDEMTDTWTLFGDPSVMVRTDNPGTISASHNPSIFLGASSFVVNVTDAEDATVALTMDGTIYGVATVEGGTATVTFDAPLSIAGTMKLVITAFNKIPYMADLDVIPAEGPFVAMTGYELNDANGNGIADFGETVNITVELENIGVEPAENAVVTITTDDTYVSITDNEEDAGTINAEASITLTDAFEITVATDVPDQHIAAFELTTTAGDESWESSFSITLNAPVFNSGTLTVDDAAGNNNGRLDPGETVTLTIPAINDGHADIEDVEAVLNASSGYVSISETSVSIASLDAGETENTTYTLTCDAAAPVGTAIALTYQLAGGEYSFMTDYTITAGLIIEDYESGSFDSYDWSFSGDAAWSIVTDDVYEGENASKSDVITDSQSAEMIMNYEVASDDYISFYLKVSSESGYDELTFYIDGESMGEWSGELDWQQAEFAVDAGEHTFQWVYAKDGSVSSGDDRAWVDFIVLPAGVSSAMTVSAGMDMSVCGETTCQVNGMAANYNSALWTTAGDGSFDDATAMNPVYTAGTDDMNNGAVVLTFTASGDDGDMTDDMTLTLNQQPTAMAGEDAAVCAGDTYQLTASAENYASIQWTTTGTGTFDNEAALDAIYTPSEDDIAGGSVTLMVSAMGEAGCTDAADELAMAINSAPQAAAMPAGTQELCADSQESYTVATVEGATSYTWNITPAEAGDVVGTTNEVLVDWAVDYAGAAELTVMASNGCGNGDASEALAITINAMPSAAFTSDIEEVDLVYVTNSVFTATDAENYESMSWTIDPAEAASETTEDGTSVEVVWNTAYVGNVTVQFHAENMCGETILEHALLVKNTVGIENPDSYTTMIYPNPNNGSFKLQLSSNVEQEVSISVMSAVGRIIYNELNVQVNDNYETTINLGDAADGVYYLIIENENARRIEKVVVK